MLAPAGPHAESIATLLYVHFALLAAVWIAVLVAMLVAREHPGDERYQRRPRPRTASPRSRTSRSQAW
ncbi:MAG TPA: hypothetical protein VLC53_01645 [Myxococcota bacterium]|nr:hypothetical protein [Myxococcota bacterium]